jgi:hypothetical protein
MKDELDKKLFDKFPHMFKTRHDRMQSCMGFGFECGDGWYNIMYELMQKIDDFIEDGENVEIQQVKEKFGTLRFYYNYDYNGWNWWITCPRFLSRFRWCYRLFSKINIFVNKIRKDLFNYYTRGEIVSQMVDDAYNLTYKTCELCGAKGKMRTEGWNIVLCKECFSDKKEPIL